MADDEDKNYKHSKSVKLKIVMVYLKSYFEKDDQGIVLKARNMLKEHNLDLDIWPNQDGKKEAANTLDFGSMAENPIKHKQEAYKELRKRVKEHIGSRCTFSLYVPVIMCQFEHPGYGITPSMIKDVTAGCLIAPTLNKDKVTLVHELGHCAGLDHLDDLHLGNFMHEAEPRSFMYRYQVEKMATSNFAV